MKKIIFLCTGNSCRSQMAEGFAKKIFDLENYQIDSAGVRADGINEYAVKVMLEVDIDISIQESTSLNTLNLDVYDLIVTVCDHAHGCLNVNIININKRNIIHKHFPDPILVKGDNDQVMNAYRYTRDLIKDYIQEIQINFNKYIEDGKK